MTRLEALGALGGLPHAAVSRLVASAVQTVVHLERDRAGRRRLTTVAVVEHTDSGVTVVPAFTVTPDGEARPDLGATTWSQRLGLAGPS
jgi:pilus assembly protein CpaF